MATLRYVRKYKIKNNKDANVLKIEIYYDLGGPNLFTYKNEKRGYYFSLTPVKVEGAWESYTAFSGSKTCIEEASRKSKKKFEEVCKRMDQLINKYRELILRSYDVDLNDYTEIVTS